MLAPGASVKKAAGALRQALQKDGLRQQGYTWKDTEQYEHEVNVLQRFLVDTSVSGGGCAFTFSYTPCLGSFLDCCLRKQQGPTNGRQHAVTLNVQCICTTLFVLHLQCTPGTYPCSRRNFRSI